MRRKAVLLLINAARALDKASEFGIVAEGQQADLLLLEANPLENVANAKRRAGVMLRGLWMAETEIQDMLGGLAASYTPTLVKRIWPLAVIVMALLLLVSQTAK